MRHLIDTYIEADQPRVISPFDNMSLLELIVKTGIANAINRLPDRIKSSKSAIAETIENNVRRKIVKEHLNDSAFYDRMSALLDEIIAALEPTHNHRFVALMDLFVPNWQLYREVLNRLPVRHESWEY